ncbi:prostate-associated microseminoprotein-like [Ostrea edulis]|uniref:prostate-associated microseminoprotein-like n=1 Tax=Ostrea edulis TaxID=37623 RepID=UPI0020943A74|nr:prostate-associated microseminoprotein-like [Ostrea edulis]
MTRLYFAVCAVLLVVTYSEASCWMELPRDDIENCQYRGITIARGDEYRNRTPPDCFRCSCGSDGTLSCCSEGTILRNVPPTCKVLQKGCDQVAVSKDDERQPCSEPVSAVTG